MHILKTYLYDTAWRDLQTMDNTVLHQVLFPSDSGVLASKPAVFLIRLPKFHVTSRIGDVMFLYMVACLYSLRVARPKNV